MKDPRKPFDHLPSSMRGSLDPLAAFVNEFIRVVVWALLTVTMGGVLLLMFLALFAPPRV